MYYLVIYPYVVEEFIYQNHKAIFGNESALLCLGSNVLDGVCPSSGIFMIKEHKVLSLMSLTLRSFTCDVHINKRFIELFDVVSYPFSSDAAYLLAK